MSPSKSKPRRSTRKSRGQYPSANLKGLCDLRNQKGRRIPRVTASELNGDLLLEIFDWYRIYSATPRNASHPLDLFWDRERWWYKPIHVCRKWRHLILSSPNRLDLHLVCTYGTPVEDMLSHSPPLPLIIYYPSLTYKIPAADEEGIIYALQQPDRVHRINVTAPTTVLCKLFIAMACEFPILERLFLGLSTTSRAGSALPEKFLAPLLRHLTLFKISLPIQSQLLRQAENLITLRFWELSASPEFHPAHLVAQLLGMSRLEILEVQFYTAIPNRRFESPAQPIPITLPSLKRLYFLGGSTYLEGILARINAPFLSKFNVTYFNQLTFNLSHLLQFVHTIGTFSFRFTDIHFGEKSVSVVADKLPIRAGSYSFSVRVECQPLGWQAACAAQICHTLNPLLAGAERLTIGFHKDGSEPWKDEIDVEMWHGFLRTFAGVKSLQFTGALVGNLLRLLQLDEGVLPLKLLPKLPEAMPSAPNAQPTPTE